MKKIIKQFRQTPFGLSLLIISLVSVVAFSKAYANTYNSGYSNTQYTGTSNTGYNQMGIGGSGNETGSGNGQANNSYIQTGNATTNGIVSNNINTNIFKYGCNCTPTPSQVSPTPTPGGENVTPTPTPGGGQVATPTPTPSSLGGSGGSTSGGSSVGSSEVKGAAGPTQAVLGLSYTAGNENGKYLFYILGFVCLVMAAKLAKPLERVR